jgi:hypothetical protein
VTQAGPRHTADLVAPSQARTDTTSDLVGLAGLPGAAQAFTTTLGDLAARGTAEAPDPLDAEALADRPSGPASLPKELVVDVRDPLGDWTMTTRHAARVVSVHVTGAADLGAALHVAGPEIQAALMAGGHDLGNLTWSSSDGGARQEHAPSQQPSATPTRTRATAETRGPRAPRGRLDGIA